MMRSTRFNGAATLPPRKRVRLTELEPHWTCFNGAATLPPRKRRDLIFPVARRARFNGAATLPPRKLVNGHRAPPSFPEASTEPRRCRRGNAGSADSRSGESRASTEPRRCRRGNAVADDERHLVDVLQRSRDVAAAETHGRVRSRCARVQASTEPRRCRRGNFLMTSPCASCRSASTEPRRCRRGNGRDGHARHVALALQRSRDVAAAETQNLLSMIYDVMPLQRSRDVAAAETLGEPGFARVVVGFNGAATLPPRKLPQRQRRAGMVSRASTEPRRCRRGNVERVAAAISTALASTEPRRCRRGNRTAASRRPIAVGLQRSRDVAAAETMSASAHWSGDAMLLQRSRDVAAAETMSASAHWSGDAMLLQRSRDVAAAETHRLLQTGKAPT